MSSALQSRSARRWAIEEPTEELSWATEDSRGANNYRLPSERLPPGKRASRVRALWRATVTWTPVVLTLALFVFERGGVRPFVFALQYALMLGMAGAAAWAIIRPSRSIQDRLAGTWIVPR